MQVESDLPYLFRTALFDYLRVDVSRGVSHKGLIEEAGLDTGYFTPDELYLLRQVREVVWLLLRVLPRRSSSKPPRRLYLHHPAMSGIAVRSGSAEANRSQITVPPLALQSPPRSRREIVPSSLS